jgi:hypothetical protein
VSKAETGGEIRLMQGPGSAQESADFNIAPWPPPYRGSKK